MNVQNNPDSDGGSFLEPHQDNASGANGLQLVDFLRIARTRWQLIAGTVAVIMALTIVVLFQLTPLYRASAVVMLDQRKNNVEDVNAVLSGLPTDPSSIQNQVQILTSRELASRVIDRLKLDQNPEFNANAIAPWKKLFAWASPARWFGEQVSTQTATEEAAAERAALIDAFLAKLTVDPIGLSTAINVSFDSPYASQSAAITNAVAEEYVEDQLNAKFEATQKATQWLADRINQLAKQVQLADSAVQQYKADNNLTETSDGSSIVNQQLATVNAQLIAAKSDLAQKQAIYGRVAALARAGRADDVSQAVASPLIAQLRGQESEMLQQEATLSTQFGPRHPKILEIESQKKNLQAKIGEEVQRIVGTVGNDVAVSSANVASLQNSLAQLEGQSQGQSKASVKLKALEAAAESSRSMYQAYIGRLKETQGQEGIQSPDARVISAAEIPVSPSFPRKTLIIGAALPLSIILGLMLAFAAERLDAGFRTPAQVEQILGLPVLGSIPEIAAPRDGESINAADRVIDKPMSSFAEAIRGIQLGLALSNVDSEPKVIVVTSSVPGEGKTTVAVSLARLAARGGKRAVLVECDLRRPTLAKVAGLGTPKFGITDVLLGREPLDTCLTKDPKSNLLVLPCTDKPPSPADLLASNAMEKLISDLRRAFDVVIIDSAPLLPVNDTRIMSRVADTFLFVTRWEKTPRDAAQAALRSLVEMRTPVAGVALARTDAERFQYYTYGYQNYSNYNKYYND